MELYRRTLFKVLGLTAAGSALPGCEREVHNLVPYLLPDDHIVPGVADWYASTCRECEAGCGILVRVMEGRAKKIEGNPDHPLNEGKLCARGQAALQGLYNPDRLQGPLKRSGPRGSGEFQPVSWEEGLSEWVGQLQQHPGASAMMTRPLTGTLAELLTTVMQELSGRLVPYESGGDHTVRTANALCFGTPTLPHYDLSNADYLLSFGTPFLEHWLSPVSFGVAYGRFRQGRPLVRGRFIQVEPRLSLTAANADRWIPVPPGTEGLLALGIGRIFIEEQLTPSASSAPEEVQRLFSSFSLEHLAAATDVSRKTMAQLARELASAKAPLIMGGGPAAAQTNGTETLIIINVLNMLLGNVGRRGGLLWPEPADHIHDAVAPAPQPERAVMDLAEEFDRGARTVLHLYHTNPLFSLPPSLKFERVFQQAAYIVSFSPFMDESTLMADLILPDHSHLESWGDHAYAETSPVPALGLSQPVVRPLYQTRAIGDVWLDAARRLGGPLNERLPWPTFHDILQRRWQTVLERTGGTEVPFETQWTQALQQGGWWPSTTRHRRMNSTVPSLTYTPPEYAGDATEYPFLLWPYTSLTLQDGRGANLPWLQELPDPLTTAMWGTWIELNPATAGKLGIHQGDRLRVISGYGTLEAPAVLFPGLHPDLIAIPIGQGHQAYGRYAKDRGANPLVLLGPNFDPRSGSLATGATRVRIERVKGGTELPMLDESGQHPVAHRIQLTGGL